MEEYFILWLLSITEAQHYSYQYFLTLFLEYCLPVEENLQLGNFVLYIYYSYVYRITYAKLVREKVVKS